MKARIKQNPKDGSWWCFRMGCAGTGASPEEAWNDMWKLYKEACNIKATNVTIT